MVVGAFAFALLLLPPAVWAETVEELKQRLMELEQTMTQEIQALKRLIQQKEAKRQAEQEKGMRVLEKKQREVLILQEQLREEQEKLREEQRSLAQGGRKSLKDFWDLFDKEAGAKVSNEGQPPLGKDIQGNVYTGDTFKIRLGGSLRTHWLWQDTLRADFVSSALRPTTPGGNSENRENFRISTRRTRINLTFAGPETLGGRPRRSSS